MIRRLERPLIWIALAVALCAIVVRLVPYHGPHMGLNLTASMPIGAYTTSTDLSGVRAGSEVAVCLPVAGIRFAQQHHLAIERVDHSPCYQQYEPLFKIVVAVPGDRVRVTDAGVMVNGKLVAKSVPVMQLDDGSPLPRAGATIVPPGTVWAWTPAPRSYDSRYWGPMRVVAQIAPALTWGTSR